MQPSPGHGNLPHITRHSFSLSSFSVEASFCAVVLAEAVAFEGVISPAALLEDVAPATDPGPVNPPAMVTEDDSPGVILGLKEFAAADSSDLAKVAFVAFRETTSL